MKTINLNTGEGVTITIFPDGQPHVNVQAVQDGDEVKDGLLNYRYQQALTVTGNIQCTG